VHQRTPRGAVREDPHISGEDCVPDEVVQHDVCA